jgi:hydroxymethylglutaryl-CoA lyase
MLNGLGIETGVDLNRLVKAGNAISAALGRPTQSRVASAMTGSRDPG